MIKIFLDSNKKYSNQLISFYQDKINCILNTQINEVYINKLTLDISAESRYINIVDIFGSFEEILKNMLKEYIKKEIHENIPIRKKIETSLEKHAFHWKRIRLIKKWMKEYLPLKLTENIFFNKEERIYAEIWEKYIKNLYDFRSIAVHTLWKEETLNYDIKKIIISYFILTSFLIKIENGLSDQHLISQEDHLDMKELSITFKEEEDIYNIFNEEEIKVIGIKIKDFN